jgi:hypothetical protein
MKKKHFQEDAPVNCVGGGAIAGAPPDSPPVRKKPVLLRRKRLKESVADLKGMPQQSIPQVDMNAPFLKMTRFAGNDVFVVHPDMYIKCLHGKNRYHTYERYVGNDPTGEAIRNYGKHDTARPIIVQCEQTGAMTYLRYGKKKC